MLVLTSNIQFLHHFGNLSSFLLCCCWFCTTILKCNCCFPLFSKAMSFFHDNIEFMTLYWCSNCEHQIGATYLVLRSHTHLFASNLATYFIPWGQFHFSEFQFHFAEYPRVRLGYIVPQIRGSWVHPIFGDNILRGAFKEAKITIKGKSHISGNSFTYGKMCFL